MNHKELVINTVESQNNENLHVIPPYENIILSSWQRCLEIYNITPQKKNHFVIKEVSDLRERQERLNRLISIAEPQMKRLYKAFYHSSYAIILTDSDGVIIDHLYHDNYKNDFRAAGLWLGADWCEQHQGTNGIGTSLMVGFPVTVHLTEHYHTYNTKLTCSGAPIYDIDGSIIAVLDASSCLDDESKNTQAHVLALVRDTALCIENQFFLANHFNRRVLRIHPLPTGVTFLGEGMIVLDDEDCIVAVNNTACTMLGVKRCNLHGNINHFLNITEGPNASLKQLCRFKVSNHPDRFVFGVFYQGGARSLTSKSKEYNRSFTVNSDQLLALDLNHLASQTTAMAEQIDLIKRIIDRDIPIMISGETGVGKEVLARAIHEASERKDQPFVAVNCASIPESLIESELFGYCNGAFTGANRSGRKGKLLESSGGTLFLDEIGDMPVKLQAHLLRAIESNSISPLGSEQSVQVDLRVITASHQNLEQMVRENLFREDLFYRIKGLKVHLPPLREREDKIALIRAIIAHENCRGDNFTITHCALSYINRYNWPGNVRELRNILRIAMALCDDGMIDMAALRKAGLNQVQNNLPHPPSTSLPSRTTEVVELISDDTIEANPLANAESLALQQSLSNYHWNISHTAKALNISRNTLYRKMRRHGISLHEKP